MNKIELVSLIREIVVDEIKKNLKPIREALKETVRKEVDHLLTEMEVNTPEIQENVVGRPGSRQGMHLANITGKSKRSVASQQEKPILTFSKNSTLNELLTKTVVDMREGRSQPLMSDERGGAPSVYMEGASDIRASVGGSGVLQGSIAEQFEPSGKSVASMLPDKDVNGNPLVLRSVPEHVATAITRDYSKFLKKVDKRK